MGRSQRHKVIFQNTDSQGKGLSEKQAAPRYINQYANSQAFSNFTGPTGGPLQGSTMAGFPPTLIPPPGVLAASEEEIQDRQYVWGPGEFTDPGQFNLSGNPRYESLPESNTDTDSGPEPGPEPEPGEEPTLNSINPSSAKIGDPDVTMNVNGNNFTDTSLIYFNGGAETTEFVDEGQLRTVVKPSTATTPGDYPVWVQQGSFQTVTQKTFTFLDPVATQTRTFPIGPTPIAMVEDHADGLQVTLSEAADVQVGDQVTIEATGNTSVNGSYPVLNSDGTVVVVDNQYELATPIENHGRLIVTGA